MYGKTASSEQLHTRSGSHATKGSAKGFSLLGGGESPLAVMTPEDERESLKAKLAVLKEKIKLTQGDQRRAIGQEIQEIEKAISQIRKAWKSEDAASLPHLFMDACRDLLSKHQFKVLMDEANRRQRALINNERKS